MQSNWITTKDTPALQNSEIHIWRILVTDFIPQLNQYWQFLNITEQQQAKKFIQIKHQNRFIIIHGILRKIVSNYLSIYLDIAPNKINFITNKFGKPSLSSHEALNFNISHSNDIALLAFTKNNNIGIDVEYNKKNIEILEIANKFFTPKEANNINNLPIKLQLEHFFTYWTFKEAFIKAIGKGLSYSLKNFSIDIDNLKIHTDDPEYKNFNWSLLKLDTFPNYSAAIATTGNFDKLSLLDFAVTN
jgi:4'-phosphopantetheinyl transferase